MGKKIVGREKALHPSKKARNSATIRFRESAASTARIVSGVALSAAVQRHGKGSSQAPEGSEGIGARVIEKRQKSRLLLQ